MMVSVYNACAQDRNAIYLVCLLRFYMLGISASDQLVLVKSSCSLQCH
jgi:hypothetical protein